MTPRRLVASLFAAALALAACGSLRDAQVAAPPPRLDVANFVVVDDGIAVSGQPSAADLAAARAAGYGTVVSFRPSDESPESGAEAAACAGLGLHYVEIPVRGTDVRPEHAKELAAVLAGADGPVLLHCRSGGRASGVWTLFLANERGVEADAALLAGERAGMKPDVRAVVERRIH